MKNNIKVQLIENDRKELTNILSQINSGFSIIYSNSKINIKIGNHEVNTEYKTILYNEKNNTLIILSNNSMFDSVDLINYLEDNNLLYGEITFKKSDEVLDDKICSNIHIVNSKKELEKILLSNKDNNYNACLFYPFLNCKFHLRYESIYDELYDIFIQQYNGLIQFENKLILINDKICIKSILNLLNNKDIIVDLITDQEPNIFLENDDKCKKLIKSLN